MKSEAGFRPSSRMASKNVEFHEGAALDIDSALDWYLQRSESAAQRFFDELDRAVGKYVRGFVELRSRSNGVWTEATGYATAGDICTCAPAPYRCGPQVLPAYGLQDSRNQ